MKFTTNLYLLSLLCFCLISCGGGGDSTTTSSNSDQGNITQPDDTNNSNDDTANNDDSTNDNGNTGNNNNNVDVAPCSDDCAFSGDIVLGRPSANSIAISLISEVSGQANISYNPIGSSTSLQSQLVYPQAEEPVVIELTGLQGNTAYQYKVNFNTESNNSFIQYATHSFHTQRSAEDTFSFAIHADPHLGIRIRGPEEEEKADEAHYAKTMSNTLNADVDFLIDLGDTFMAEKNASRDFYDQLDDDDKTDPLRIWVEQDYQRVRGYFSQITHSIPLYLVNGNHEGETGWQKDDPDSIAVWANNLRKSYFPVATANNFYSGSTEVEPYVNTHDGYYSWQWGDALFIALDPFWYGEAKAKVGTEWNWTLGKDQYDWLEQQLTNSSASYTFIFLHNLVGGQNNETGQGRGGALVASDWEWGGYDITTNSDTFNEQRPTWDKPIHHLLVEHGVNVVFHGHDHAFVKEVHADGLIYQLVPQPSVLNDTDARAIKRADEAGYDVINGNVSHGAGFIKVTVSPSSTKIDYLRTLENTVSAETCTLSTCSEIAYSYEITPENQVSDPNSNGEKSGTAMVAPADSGYANNPP